MAPADSPPEIVGTLASALHEALRTPEVKQRFAELGDDPASDTPAQFGALLRADSKRYATLAKAAGIKPSP